MQTGNLKFKLAQFVEFATRMPVIVGVLNLKVILSPLLLGMQSLKSSLGYPVGREITYFNLCKHGWQIEIEQRHVNWS